MTQLGSLFGNLLNSWRRERIAHRATIRAADFLIDFVRKNTAPEQELEARISAYEKCASGPRAQHDTVEPPEVQPLDFDSLQYLSRGLYSVSFDEFVEVTKKSLKGVTTGYAMDNWGMFQGNAFAYCMTRKPKEYGEALIRLALQKVSDIRSEEEGVQAST